MSVNDLFNEMMMERKREKEEADESFIDLHDEEELSFLRRALIDCRDKYRNLTDSQEDFVSFLLEKIENKLQKEGCISNTRTKKQNL